MSDGVPASKGAKPPAGMRPMPAPIEGFKGDGIVIGGRLYEPPLLLTPDPVRIDEVALEDVGTAIFSKLGRGIAVVLVGTGGTFRRLPASVVAAARSCGLRTEAMDSRAAARAFNLLWAEGHEVGALIL